MVLCAWGPLAALFTVAHLRQPAAVSSAETPAWAQAGTGDNWGSWLPECSVVGDAWCRASTVGIDGVFAGDDALHGYLAHPSAWSTGLRVEDLTIANTECGTALCLNAAASTIQRVTMDTAGDHVHGTDCTLNDADEPAGGWSDVRVHCER